ncbi:hypothetical protein ABZT44_48265 [Streptomyces mirabilis]
MPSEFRDRLAIDDRADRLLAVLVDRLMAAGLIKRRGRTATTVTTPNRFQMTFDVGADAVGSGVCGEQGGCTRRG